MRRIKSSELPEWFDLSRYESATNLDLAGWYANLSIRYIYLNFEASHSNQLFQHFREFTVGDGPLVMTRPEPSNLSGRSERNPLYSETPHSKLNQLSIRSLPVDYCGFVIADFLHNESDLTVQLRSAADYLWEESNSKREFASDHEIEDFLGQPMDLVKLQESNTFDQNLRVEVDMFVPDSLIMDDFKKWLKAARDIFDMPSRNIFSDADMKSWAKKQVLPFLDLTIWAKYRKAKIPDPVMGAALFPDEYDVSLSERIAKVVRPKAKWLTRESVQQAIWMQSREQE